ncbi:MAG: mechanosensitive ion channel family protein [Accumulibacter sp.]|uniref:mechanosensitive ion channel family protein n=1 Tax=Accumulibacter sp. TaxID=2053492 RepID=UPI002FC2CDE4
MHNDFIVRITGIFSNYQLADELITFLQKLTFAVVVFLGMIILGRLVNRVALPKLRHYLDDTTAAMMHALIKMVFLTMAVLAALNAAGIQTGTLLASAGVLGLTLGFALKDTLSNVISGFLIFLDRPFTINDLVEIDGQYGRVDRITLRTTRIVTNDGRMLAVPNSVVMNKTIASYTNFPNLRIDIRVNVAVTENLDLVRSILLNLIQEDPDYLKEPAPRMVVASLNDYNIAVELQAWIKEERKHIEKRFALREAIFKALVAAKVEMPLETIQLAPHRVDLYRSEQSK